MGKGFLKAKRTGVAHRGPCFVDGCKKNGGTIHTCITCEKLAMDEVINNPDPECISTRTVFSIQCCADHRELGLTKVKRHALIAHPANMLRVVAAGLKGEKI